MKQNAKDATVSSSSEEIRRARTRRLVRRLLIWVALPTLAGIIYYSFLVSSQYESVAVFTVQSNKGGKASVAKRDAMLVKEYSRSRAMLKHLVDKHGLAEHYSEKAGFLAGVDSDAPFEELFEYYREKISLEYIDDSASMRLTVLAFSGEAAQGFANAILQAAEEMTNDTASRARADRLTHAESRVKESEAELDAIESEYARLSGLRPSPVDGIEPATGPAEQTAEQAAAVEASRFKLELARQRFREAHTALEETRLSLVGDRLYLETISAPTAPTAAAYPRRIWGIMSVFVLSLVLMGVVTMLGSAVREHGRF